MLNIRNTNSEISFIIFGFAPLSYIFIHLKLVYIKSFPQSKLNHKEYYDIEFPTHCDTEETIYQYNRNRSLLSYRDALSNLFCVVFDNSWQKGKFYTDIANMDETRIKMLMSNFIETDFYKNYYSQTTGTGLILNKDRYDSGDYVRSHYNNTNPYILEGKFFIDGMGPSGQCEKNRAVKFMVNNEATSCGFKLVIKLLPFKFFNCRNHLINALCFPGIKS